MPATLDQLAALAGLKAGLVSQQTVAAGQAQASGIAAGGFQQEEAAYQAAGAITEANRAFAGIAGQLAVFQQQRQVAQTQGRARAAQAGAGATGGGSIVDILRSNFQQGALGAQFLQVQTALEQGGYAEAGAAIQAEITASEAQRQAALAEQKAFSEQATQAAAQVKELGRQFSTPATTASDTSSFGTVGVVGAEPSRGVGGGGRADSGSLGTPAIIGQHAGNPIVLPNIL